VMRPVKVSRVDNRVILFTRHISLQRLLRCLSYPYPQASATIDVACFTPKIAPLP
jgi:hypothetical protein